MASLVSVTSKEAQLMNAENIMDTPIYLALNMSKVLNNQESFDLIDKGGQGDVSLCPQFLITTEMTTRKIHDDGVMAHLIRGSYIMFFQPMMEESGWRSFLCIEETTDNIYLRSGQ
jgi:hypothetical protein